MPTGLVELTVRPIPRWVWQVHGCPVCHDAGSDWPAERETPAKQQQKKLEDSHEGPRQWPNKALDQNGGPAMLFGGLVIHWRASVGQLGR